MKKNIAATQIVHNPYVVIFGFAIDARYMIHSGSVKSKVGLDKSSLVSRYYFVFLRCNYFSQVFFFVCLIEYVRCSYFVY